MLTEIKDVVLLHGIFKAEFFEQVKNSNAKDIVVLEGRPSLEAARDSSAHLQRIGLVPTVMADNMAGYLFSKGLVKEVWLAAQAADKNGAMCEIGSLILAVLAKKHNVPVLVDIRTGVKKAKTFGKASDLQKFNGHTVVAGKVKTFVPLIEWVPAKYLRGKS